MLPCTQCRHETRLLRTWNTSLQTWAHREHLSQTGHKSTNHGVLTMCVARMAFGGNTQRLTLHRMAKLSALGHSYRNGECMLETAGHPKWLWPLALCFGYIFLCQKQMFPLCAQQYAVWNFLWRKADPEWDATFGCRAFLGQEETGQQGSERGSSWATRTEASVSTCALKMELLSESRARCGHRGKRRSTWTASQEPVRLSTQRWLTIDAGRRQSIMTLVYMTWRVHHQIFSKQK